MVALPNLQMRQKKMYMHYLKVYLIKKVLLVEPTAVAVQAVKEGKLLFGDTVAVFGAGPIGLLTIVAAKAAGASKIFVFDLSEERLAKAKEVGATHVVNSGNTNPVDFINEHTENGVDVTFEVAGVGVTLSQSVQVTRPRGTVVIVSIFAHAVDFDQCY